MGSALFGEGFDPPPEVRDGVEFHWFHVSGAQSLVLCVLSQRPVWYVGHYVRGRMLPCVGDACDHCVAGVGRQLRYVVCAAEMSTRQMGVVELGPVNGRVLRDVAVQNNGLRGTCIELVRVGRSKHSRLDLHVLDMVAPPWALAKQPFDLEHVLRLTWERLERDGALVKRR